MEDVRTSDPKPFAAARDTTSKTRNSKAEKIVSEAETRSVPSAAKSVEDEAEEKRGASSYLGMAREPTESRGATPPSGDDKAAPLSSALGVPTLVNEDSETSAGKTADSRREDGDVYFSSRWFPLLSDNPTPLSTALNIPVLLKETKPASKTSQR